MVTYICFSYSLTNSTTPIARGAHDAPHSVGAVGHRRRVRSEGREQLGLHADRRTARECARDEAPLGFHHLHHPRARKYNNVVLRSSSTSIANQPFLRLLCSFRFVRSFDHTMRYFLEVIYVTTIMFTIHNKTS